MGFLGELFGSIFGESDSSSQVSHPCTNCPSNCRIAPTACSICQPYKEKMIDAIYRVEHKDEILAQYEVTGTAAAAGAVTCPHCGGASENHYICDFCGSTLQEGSGKIQVASAADIPNPVLEAQDIIFERYDAVKNIAGDGYGLGDALSGIGSEGLFSSVLSALIGADPNDKKSIGQKMTEDEINDMAAAYGVSVSAYLTGLDNGKYLTMSNKNLYAETERRYSQGGGSSSLNLGSIAGIAGAAGLGAAGLSSIFGLRSGRNNMYGHQAPPMQPGRNGMPGHQMPPQQPGRNEMPGHQVPPQQPERNGMPGRQTPQQPGRNGMPGRQVPPMQPDRNGMQGRQTAPAQPGRGSMPHMEQQRKTSSPSRPSGGRPAGGRPSEPMGGPGGRGMGGRPGR